MCHTLILAKSPPKEKNKKKTKNVFFTTFGERKLVSLPTARSGLLSPFVIGRGEFSHLWRSVCSMGDRPTFANALPQMRKFDPADFARQLTTRPNYPMAISVSCDLTLALIKLAQ